jgi:hypothetical protein
MNVCTDIVPVKKGDKIAVVAQYNLEKHPARAHANGAEAEEMGLALFSFAADSSTVETGKSIGLEWMSHAVESATLGLATITAVPVLFGLTAGAVGASIPFILFAPAIKTIFGV